MANTYVIKECYATIQGEGLNTGVPMVLLRFSGCNLSCDFAPGPRSPGGWRCDTDFAGGDRLTLDEIEHLVATTAEQAGMKTPCWIMLTGGEPSLQLDRDFCYRFRQRGWKLAVETNGTRRLPFRMRTITRHELDQEQAAGVSGLPHVRLAMYELDWITASPKIPALIQQTVANEVKYVVAAGDPLPVPNVLAEHYLLSPAFDGQSICPKAVEHCIVLCRSNPPWRLSLQMHKLLKIR
jgi:7-carboxy-7-deazaguanine synthase